MPRCSIFAISLGSADSEDEVETMSRYSRARYFISAKMLTPAPTRRITPRTMTMKIAQVM
jgi:hypothetical protein